MVGLLVELALSWLLLWFFEKKNLSVLGLSPNKARLGGLFLLLILAASCSALGIWMRTLFFKEQYEVNPALTPWLVWEGFRWNLVSVLYEEFIFRGALLYILIKRIGATKAIWISAVAFGIYHWFSYNLFWNVPAMVTIFIITGAIGLTLAFAYVRTSSMYLAIGFHFGWNFTNGFIFSTGTIGNGVFCLKPDQPVVTVSYFVYYTVTLLPIILAFSLGCLLIRRLTNKPATLPS